MTRHVDPEFKEMERQFGSLLSEKCIGA